MLNLPLNNNNNLLRFVEQPNSHIYALFGCRADVLSLFLLWLFPFDGLLCIFGRSRLLSSSHIFRSSLRVLRTFLLSAFP